MIAVNLLNIIKFKILFANITLQTFNLTLMKPKLLFCGAITAVLLTGCTGVNNSTDWHKTLALVVILAIIVGFLALAIFSNMLRDQVNDCTAYVLKADAADPFSLSRVQLGVWTVVISCTYVYLALCRGNCDMIGINQTALVLMGIGASVTTAGTLIDKRDIQANVPRHQNAPSQGFLIDILSDQKGISIYRAQNVVWTVIAIIAYLNQVYMVKTGCALPELSDTLLSLTGISGATYVVLKSQENTTAPATNNPTTAAAPGVTAAAPGVAAAGQTVAAPVADQAPPATDIPPAQ